jgi:hypothetical protein
MLGVFLAMFVIDGSKGQDPAATIGQFFSPCGLRGDPPFGEPHAAAILIWLSALQALRLRLQTTVTV